MDEVVLVDQSALGRTPRANAATYVGAWDGIRALLRADPEAQAARLHRVARSRSTCPGGRCERCTGEGFEKVEMQFLSDVYVPCADCDGTRFRPEVLEVRVRRASRSPTCSALTVAEALRALRGASRASPRPLRRSPTSASTTCASGQPLSTLSGGEAQRLRLAAALAEPRRAAHALFIFDEPTTGLHLEDVAVLLRALARLVERGHGVLVVEHHLDVLKCADWVIDLGPEGGADGGRVVADGPAGGDRARRRRHGALPARADREPARFAAPRALAPVARRARARRRPRSACAAPASTT